MGYTQLNESFHDQDRQIALICPFCHWICRNLRAVQTFSDTNCDLDWLGYMKTANLGLNFNTPGWENGYPARNKRKNGPSTRNLPLIIPFLVFSG